MKSSLAAELRSQALVHPNLLSSPSNERDHIAIEQLSIRYGRQVVIEDLTLHLPRNSVTALIGPSGCGKSSVLCVLNRLHELISCCNMSGSIRYSWLDDELASSNSTALRREVGMLFQRPNPFPFSIWRNIEFALKRHGVKNRTEIADRIEASLCEVGLWDEVHTRLNASALSLSGGQQQRLCLARALVLDPSVLLMDEPCSALDPMSTQLIEALVLRLASRRTIVMVTHSLAQARRVADQVALLWKIDGVGQLVEYAPADALFDRPQHELTRSYLEFA